MNNIEEIIKQINRMYLQRGFNITWIHTDKDFEPLRLEVASLDSALNCFPNKLNFPYIERFNQTIKELVQSDRAAVPFTPISKLRIFHLVAIRNICPNQ